MGERIFPLAVTSPLVQDTRPLLLIFPDGLTLGGTYDGMSAVLGFIRCSGGRLSAVAAA